MQFIDSTHQAFRYTGRIDFSNPICPSFIYPGSSIHVAFTGTSAALRVRNLYQCDENALGFLIDGKEGKVLLSTDAEVRDCLLADNLSAGRHELILWKRAAGGCHYFDFFGMLLDDGAEAIPLGTRPERRIECYGDSVSAGEVCEAFEYIGMVDPEGHQGKFSNSWHSYAMLSARNLGAEIHNDSQGGIAVLDDTGYFVNGKVGLVSTWDKLRYNPELGPCTSWDFASWTPHVVIMALGQNDSYPADYISTDAKKRKIWIDAYALIMKNLRLKYPNVFFVVITTLLNHEEGWDGALDEMVSSLKDDRVVRYRFARNGRGTPGHLRIAEHREMASELTGFLKSFGETIW